MMLQNVYGVELKERKSLIIFDEVQRYPTAREMIKMEDMIISKQAPSFP